MCSENFLSSFLLSPKSSRFIYFFSEEVICQSTMNPYAQIHHESTANWLRRLVNLDAPASVLDSVRAILEAERTAAQRKSNFRYFIIFIYIINY